MEEKMNKLKKTVISIAMIFALLFLFPIETMAGMEVNVGGEFIATFTVYTSDNRDIKSFSMNVNYDASLVQLISGDGSDDGAGTISVERDLSDSSVAATTLNFHFKAIAEGSLDVTATNKKFYASNHNEIQIKARNESLHVDILPEISGTRPLSEESVALTTAPTEPPAESGVDGAGPGETTVAASSTAAAVTTAVPTSRARSNDANLRRLTLSNGVLDPVFSQNIYSYAVTVPAEVSAITVNAVTANGNATYTVSGNTNLAVGSNTIVVEVMAEDRTTIQRYVIKVNKNDDKPLDIAVEPTELQTDAAEEVFTPVLSKATVTVDSIVYRISTFQPSRIPAGFRQIDYNYQGENVSAAQDADGLTLLYLQADAGIGESGFYVYNEAGANWSGFAELTVSGKTVSIIPVDEQMDIPENLEECTLRINGKKVQGWLQAGDNEKQFCVIYGINKEGEKGFYTYDIKEKTFQRYHSYSVVKYVDGGAAIDTDTYYQLLGRFSGFRKAAAIGAIVVILILLVLFVVWRRTRRQLMLLYENIEKLEQNNESDPDWYDEAMNAELLDMPGEEKKEFDPEHLEDYDEDEIYDAFLKGEISVSEDFNKEDYKKMILGQTEQNGQSDAETEDAEAEDAETEDAEEEDTETEDVSTEDTETEDTETEDTETEDTETEDTETEDTETEEAETEDADSEDTETEDEEWTEVDEDEDFRHKDQD